MKLLALIADKEKVLLLDGAMGTQLAEAGLEMGGQNNLTHPEAVLAVHRRYAGCGVDLLITNTLTMNRVYIETHKLGVDVREVNLAGARLAREAARDGQYVLGDISSTGKILAPLGELPEETARAAFREQAAVLAEGGVDGFIIETMFSLQEALCAVQACQEAAALPVFVSMAFITAEKGGRTIMGDTAAACARALTKAGASVVGVNCGEIDPFQTAAIVAKMREACPLPVLAQPNAGKPRLAGEKTVFDMSPEDFAAGIERCVAAGARLVGGCCGTSPAHIRAAARVLAKKA